MTTELERIAFVELDDASLAEVAAVGVERVVEAGETLYRPGECDLDWIVVLDGLVDILRSGPGGDVVVTTRGPRGFLGELNLLTGQRSYLTARVVVGGRVLAVAPGPFRQLLSTRPHLSDLVFRAFLARRELLRAGVGAAAIQIIGSRYSPGAMALRSLAIRARLPHTWTDLEELEDAAAFLDHLGACSTKMPLVITPTARLTNPTPAELAGHLGLTYRATPGSVVDLVVVGTGPAGLAAAVSGSSEGLDTLSLDAVGIGGQASSSSRIENYVGFPNGISGDELSNRASVQALRLGARLNSPCEVAGLRSDANVHVLTLADGSEVAARSVIVATGARYRRLAIEGLARLEGAGVYYAATELEARVCAGRAVVVVGGGNSAGQAALFLASQGCPVALAVRRGDVVETMSRYLIDRIENERAITLLRHTEVRAIHGDTHLEGATLEQRLTGTRTSISCAGLFCFIGAVPATSWLGDQIAVDDKGFVLTDRSLAAVATVAAHSSREPLRYETSVPGVFAVGDVRHGSTKRVAAAVGEGSSAVRSVHDYLTMQGLTPRRSIDCQEATCRTGAK